MEKEKRREERFSGGRDSATERSKSRIRATSKGRNIEDLVAVASWDNLDFLSSPPPDPPGVSANREEYWRAKLQDDKSSGSNLLQAAGRAEPRTPTKQPSWFSRSNPSSSPQSQPGITALPTMTQEAKQQLSQADQYHQSLPTLKAQRMSKLLTEGYTVSFLIFFAIWGTLARVGLQALTFYPGAPVAFSNLWANVAGTFIMGFLTEDMRLFREEWGTPGIEQSGDLPAEGHQPLEKERDRTSHSKIKKTIPLYVGLATGFCGSFTSFSSFMRDVFLGLSNDLPAPTYHPTTSPTMLVHRDAGYSVMAVLAVIFTTIALCYAALKTGSHLATYLDPITPTLPFRFTRRIINPLFILLGFSTWLAAILLSIFPPHPTWRGNALFACVFAPVGCLLRYYISLHLNPLLPSFPLGTFAVNIFGTAVLGMSFDLQRVPIGGVVGGGVLGCQVLQGVQDGFCGALTTVSTWMAEVDGLGRGRAYIYGVGSVVAGVSVATVVLGSVRWGVGWEGVVCGT